MFKLLFKTRENNIVPIDRKYIQNGRNGKTCTDKFRKEYGENRTTSSFNNSPGFLKRRENCLHKTPLKRYRCLP